MSVERIKGEVVFTCDRCDETLETGETDFNDARDRLEEEGWRTVIPPRGSQDWRHYCSHACFTGFD